MVEEEQPTLTFLQQLEKQKQDLDEAIRLSQAKIQELKELRATEILSGKASAGSKQEEKKPEVSDIDYAMNALKGKV